MNDLQFILPICKIDKQKRLVSGYASTPTKDMDGEVIELAAVKAALPGFMAWGGPIREMHQPKAVGKTEEAFVDDKGLYLTAKIVDDRCWKLVDEGVLKAFSIGGKKLAKKGDTITQIDLVETSLVDRPANPDCKFDIVKKAKDRGEAAGYLVKTSTAKAVKALSLSLSSAVSEFLEKAGPPAAHDGFSLPAKPLAVCKAHGSPGCADCMCKKHGTMDCAKCMAKLAKREFSTAQRASAASSGAAMPDGSYPIENIKDLHNAIQAVGRAKNPDATRRHIRRRAKALGASDTLPDSWSKSARRSARKSATAAARQTLHRYASGEFDLTKSSPSATLPFLTLKAGSAGARDGGAEGRIAESVDLTHPQEGGASLCHMQKFIRKYFSEDETMTTQAMSLDNVLLGLAKAGRVPTRAQHMAAASANMKKARKARGMARNLIASLHKAHKAAYMAKVAKLAKKGKAPSDDNDADDEFDHQGAMEKLQKAYGALDTAKTFDKAAKMHLAKAASGVSRAGQRGQEAADGNSRYTVPVGVKDLTPGEMATLSPGGDESGSFPPVLDMETVFSGKAAKGAQPNLTGYVSKDVAELMVKNAALKAENDILARAPADTGGRRPYAFNLAKLAGDGAASGVGAGDTELTKGLDMRALGTKDENGHPSDEHTKTAGAIVGRMIMSGKYGRNVFDPAFKGAGPVGVGE